MKTKLKRLIKTVAVVLAIAMFISSIPNDIGIAITALAKETVSESISTKFKSKKLLYEDTSKRDEYVKNFVAEDGTYVAATYQVPVHYKDGNGVWQEYDNTMTETSNKAVESGEPEYSAHKSDKTIRLSKKARQNKMVSMKVDGYDISWGFIGANNSKVEFIENDENLTGNDKLCVKKKLTQEAWYHNVYNGVDLQYIVSSEGVKENVVLNSKKAKGTYEIKYKIGKLNAVQTDGQTIELFDEKEKSIYTINAPAMYDANDAFSDDVTIKIKKNNGNILTVEVSADNSWLNDSERKYPVVIDPTVTASRFCNDITDGYINETSKNGGARHLYVGKTGEGWNKSYIRFNNLPNLSSGDCVIGAEMNLYSYNQSGLNGGSTADCKVEAYMITQEWSKHADMQYNQGCDGRMLDYQITDANNDWKCWDITRAVKHWYQYGQNYGIMLTTSASRPARRFFSSDNTSDDSSHPCLYVIYINTTGLNDFNSYKTCDLGDAGTLNINEYTGNVTYSFGDVDCGGNLLSANVRHTYNSNLSGENYGYGNGYRLNINTQIATTGDMLNKYNVKYPYKYIDEDGTEIYFIERGTSHIYDDEVGRGYELKLKDDNSFELTDKEGNKQYFDSSGQPITISDTNNNTIQFSYDGLWMRPSSVTDSNTNDNTKRTTHLAYSNNGYLIAVTDPAGRQVTYNYDNDNRLVNVVGYNGQTIDLSYSGNLLTGISDGTITVEITYNNGKFASYSERANSTGESHMILMAEYSEGGTVFTHPGSNNDIYSSDRIREHCVFNNYGQKITDYITDSTDTVVYGATCSSYTQTNEAKTGDRTNYKLNNKLLSNYDTSATDNLIADGNFEEGLDRFGTVISGSGNSASVTTLSNRDIAYAGARYLNFSATSVTTCETGYRYTIGNLSPGDYTLSVYVKAEGVTGNGAYARLGISDTDCVYSDGVTGTTDSAVDNGWRRISATYKISSENSTILASIGMSAGSSGNLMFDCMQLEKSSGATDFNLLINPDMENDSFWYIDNGAGNQGFTTAEKHRGNRSYHIGGDTNWEKHVVQQVPLGEVGKNDTYIFSGWTKASSVRTNGSRQFYVEAAVEYTDGSVKWMTRKNLEWSTDRWQYFYTPWSIKDGDKKPVKMSIFCCYNRNVNDCYFDDMSLTRDKSESYKYDDEGNMISVSDEAKNNSTFSYNSDNELLKSVGVTGSKFYNTYSKSNSHLLIGTYADGVKYNFENDSKGNVTKVTAGDSKISSDRQYYIRTNTNDMVLDVYMALSDNETPVGGYQIHQDNNQKWILRKQQNSDYYGISPVCAPDKYISVYGFNTNDGADIKLYEAGNSDGTLHDDQLFKLVENNDGTYSFEPNHVSGKCLGMKSDDSTRLELMPTGTEANKRFTLDPVDSESANLKMTYSSEYTESGQYTKSVTDAAGITTEYEYDEKKNELKSTTKNDVVTRYKYSLTHDTIEGNAYYLKTSDGNYVVGVVNGATSAGSKLMTSYLNRTDDEKLYFTKVDDDCYKISTQNAPGKVFSLMPDPNGYALTLQLDENYSTQKFRMIKNTDGSVSFVQPQNNKAFCSVGSVYTHMTVNDYSSVSGSKSSRFFLQPVYEGNSSSTVFTDLNKNGTVDSNESHVISNYTGGKLTSVTNGGVTYGFTYDKWGNTTSTKVGNRTLASYQYGANNGAMSAMTYGNGASVNYTYDRFGQLSSVTKNSGTTSGNYSWNYDMSGNVTKFVDQSANTTVNNVYDSIGRLVQSILRGEFGKFTKNIKYDLYNRANMLYYSYGDKTQSYGYEYNRQQQISKVTLPGGNTLNRDYDGLNRLTKSTLNSNGTSLTCDYSYEPAQIEAQGYSSDRVNFIQYKDGSGNNIRRTQYSYYHSGNLIECTDDVTGVTEQYQYDSNDQLTQELRFGQNDSGCPHLCYEYSYDNHGNILTKTIYHISDSGENESVTVIPYTYGDSDWGDLLTAYNGQTITYDEIGNPLTYRDGINFTWQNGRQMATFDNADYHISYTYDYDGIRTSKTVTDKANNVSVTTKYIYDGGKLICQETDGNQIWFIYDESGSPLGFTYNNATYYYIKNLQGDVVAVTDASFNVLANYEYDAWGNILSANDSLGNVITDSNSIANINPLRYRGYYYDVETGLYYLRSRYYDSEVGRFINADGLIDNRSAVSQNMFQYCGNNPVSYSDSDGQLFGGIFTIAVMVIVIATTFSASTAKKSNGKSKNTGKNSSKNTGKKSNRKSAKSNNGTGKSIGDLSINSFKNKDGSYSLYDSKRSRTSRNTSFHEQAFTASCSKTSIDVSLLTGGWEFDDIDLSLLNLGNASLSYGIDENGFNVGAYASIWDSSITFSAGEDDITLSLSAGSVGFSACSIGKHSEIRFGAIFGLGLSVN